MRLFKMVQKILSLVLCYFLSFSAVLAGDLSDTKQEIKQTDAEDTRTAEGELLKLEQAATRQEDMPVESADEDEASSRPWLPAAKEFDWVQLTSGEWLKGEIKSMYNDSLEFESDKLDLLNIDWEDVKYLKSYRASSIYVEGQEPVTGRLQISGDRVTITNGDGIQEFERLKLISLSPSGDKEKDLWAVKFTLGLNVQGGNTNQLDYSSKFNAKRRTAKSRFTFDYIGNISKTGNESKVLTETVNNNRILSSMNIYATRYFFYTPVFVELYRDPFQNIAQRMSIGVGLGYTLLDTSRFEWHVNGGPAFLSTRYISVQQGERQKIDAPALVLGTDVETEISSSLDFIFKYNLQASKPESGGYAHHIIATFESEITGSLDFDISIIWDRISQPTKDDLGVAPDPDDYRLTVGITYTY